MRVYTPTELRVQAKRNLQCSVDGTHVDNEDDLVGEVESAVLASVSTYEMLLESGVSREQARGVLPQNMYTMFWMSGNLHNWYKMLKLRLHEHTQLETRLIAEAMIAHIDGKFPITTQLVSDTKFMPLRDPSLSTSLTESL
jgi:thymidylate synthase (FAD)